MIANKSGPNDNQSPNLVTLGDTGAVRGNLENHSFGKAEQAHFNKKNCNKDDLHFSFRQTFGQQQKVLKEHSVTRCFFVKSSPILQMMAQ